MIRSMLAAVSGLRNHQTFLDVIGNNIANVNTTGFKASRVLFSDILSQLGRNASSPQEGQGGINPMQVGLGMQVSGADTIQTQGNFQSTGKFTDLAIQGDGFFILNDGTRDFYSRDGSFDVAIDGTLVNPATGMKVQGWLPDATGAIDTAQPLAGIKIPFGEAMSGQPSTEIAVRGNLDAGLNGYGTITQSNTAGGVGSLSGVYTGTTNLSYSVRIAAVGAGGAVTSIEVSTDGGTTYGAPIAVGVPPTAIGNGLSIDIATNTTNAVGNTYSFTAAPPTIETNVGVYDSLGSLHTVKLTFTKTGLNTWDWLATTSEAGVTVAPATATAFTFGATGAYTGTRPAGTISLTLTNGASSPEAVTLDLSNLTQLSGNGEAHATTDGAPAGSLVSFSVDQTGEVVGVYTNGLSKMIGQIALAKFDNATGLLKSGKNLFEVSANSGNPAVGTPGSGGRGMVSSGYLEMSNVDLALQFTNMIMAERGFQANARVITASDEMLQDLVNLKR
ncbi:MAG: flagellar hook protein FlgE [Chloroflexi bacterium]|nr:flagellar hook protein FlgE [Chloroflexota bacterium]